MHQSRTLDVGLDVHQDSIAVASVAQALFSGGVFLGPLESRPCDSEQLLRKLRSKSPHLVFAHEAGPCGDWRSRDLPKTGHSCWVVAPSLMPNKAGDRVNTDRRDAVERARLRRSGDLTPVAVPPVEDEAIRDLRRAREDPIRELTAAQCRLRAFPLRQDSRSTGQATGGPAHLRCRSDVVCAPPAQHSVVQESVRAMSEPTERLQRLEHELHEQVHTWRLQPVVAALPALRGGPFTVAVTAIAELGELTRVDNPRPLRSALRLTPSESSSGERRHQGSITKPGNAHARHALVEEAWAYRYPANVSRHLPLPLETLPNTGQDSSWKARVRRCKRYRRLSARGKHPHHVVVAVTRALVAFLWAIANEVPVTP